jgi:Super-infection exclusion protein B
MSGDQLAAAVQSFLDWVKAPWKFSTIVFAISSFALLAPKSWLQAIRMTAWVEHFWPWLVVIWAFSGVFLTITVIEELAKPRMTAREREREVEEKQRKLERIFKALVSDEIGVLRSYSGGHSTRVFQGGEAVVRNLVDKGLLHNVSDKHEFYQGFSLTEQVMDYLEAKNFKTVGEAIASLQGKQEPR